MAECGDDDITGGLLCTLEILQDAPLWNLVADINTW
jgi:hypothetical protein